VDLRDLDTDPVRQLAAWLDEARAAGIALPEATALATATPDGRPSVRMVLLRGISDDGLAFYTNRESRKALEVAANPHAALVCYWQQLDRQARAEGTVDRLDDTASDAYFRTRPRGSRLAAWASPQSQRIDGREELERRYADVEKRFAGEDEVPLPPFWGGYRLVPSVVELWHGRANRLHDRVRYERGPDGWSRFRLAP
jgi:pyridoxamine 5'-phosphate oxidase